MPVGGRGSERPAPAQPGEASEVAVRGDPFATRLDGEGGEPAVPSENCVETEDGGFAADGVLTEDEPGIEGVEVQLLQTDCAGPLIGSILTNADGAYAFSDLAAGSYCVLIDPLANPNSSILIPGGWTSAAEGSAVVEVAAGQTVPDLNFGWDHQFLPEPGEVEPTATPEPLLEPPGTWCVACQGLCGVPW